MYKAKIIQFGDEPNDLFPFMPFEEEDDWDETVDTSLLPLSDNDGSFRARGFDQSRRPIKTLIKRFNLYSEELLSLLGREYMTLMRDWMYRTLRGGVKRLYILMADGTIRWTKAEAVSIPYSSSFVRSSKWYPQTVDFVIHDSFFYEIDDPTFFFNLPIVSMSMGKLNIDDYNPVANLVTTNANTIISDCSYSGVVIKDTTLSGYVADECALAECSVDPCYTSLFGNQIPIIGTTDNEFYVKGSAGATEPLIGLVTANSGTMITPKIINLNTGVELVYNNSESGGKFWVIDLGADLSEDLDTKPVQTNIDGFDVDDLQIVNGTRFELKFGTNNIRVEGLSDGFLVLDSKNKYYN